MKLPKSLRPKHFRATLAEFFEKVRQNEGLRLWLMAEFAKHYQKQYDKDGREHWIWKRYVQKNGYAQTTVGIWRMLIHRFSYELYKGAIPDGLQIDHHCKILLCINPAHLEAVTAKVNVGRSMVGVHELRKTHCPRGHPYNEKNTYSRKTNRGGYARFCRECNRQRSALVRAAAKAKTLVPVPTAPAEFAGAGAADLFRVAGVEAE